MKMAFASFFASAVRFATMAALAASLSVSGRILDNFDSGVKIGWQDFTALGGSVVESGGQFTITDAVQNNPTFTGSKKTTESFTIEDGRTLEFRVDLASASPNNQSIAVLVWQPVGASIATLAGYGFAKGADDVLITKALNQYFYADSPTPQIKNNNVILVLRLTGQGTNVIVNARVLDKDNNNQIIFDHTITDTSASETAPDPETHPASYVGVAGNFVLLNYKDSGATDSVIVFDNAQVFDSANIVVDNFDSNVKTGWSDTLQGGTVTENNMQFNITTVPLKQQSFTGSRKTSQSFTIEDGGRVELSLDVITATENSDAYAVLAWIPTANGLASLAGYGFAHSSDDVLLSKALGEYFAEGTPSLLVNNVRMVYALTGEGANVRLEARLEDLTLDVNDPNRISFQISALDTPASETSGTETPPTSYEGTNGQFVIIVFNGGGVSGGVDMSFDNAAVSYAVAGALNVSASISDIVPEDGANFVDPATGTVSFTVSDDKTIPSSTIELFLNGARYTNGSPGFTLGGLPDNRTVTYSGLAANVNYNASIRVTDSDGHVTIASFSFDTFTPEGMAGTLVIESEDYNYGAGQYIDFTALIIWPESTSDSGSYNGLSGVAEVDFHDTRATVSSDPELRRHRPDPPGNGQTADLVRSKFSEAGGTDLGVYDYMIRDIRDGEWLNYTKTFPASSTYSVYLRQAQFTLPVSLVVLENVTGDPTLPDQTTVPLGSFIGSASGFEAYRNVPLTDGTGGNLVVRLSGQTTLRVSQRLTGNDDSILRQNYLLFIPAADPGKLRAFVSDVRPAPGESINSVVPVVTARIVNRDTAVNTNSIQLQLDGAAVSPTVVPDPNGDGASLAYPLSPLPLPGSHTSTLIFKDSDGVSQTNRWSFVLGYNLLRAANSIPAGSLSASGWMVRVVQTNGPTLGNSLMRAEQQLAMPPLIPYEVATNDILQVLNFNESGASVGYFGGDSTIPGLPAADYNNIAMEAFAYLELAAGAHRFGAKSDDGFQLRSGSSLADPGATVLGVRDGGTYDGVFDFVAEAAGLYPARLVWYENGGAAYFELFSVDFNDPTARTLLNDPNSPGAVPVWVPIRLASSSQVSGSYTFDASAVVDPIAKTITVASSGATRFYRVTAPSSVHITGITLAAGTVVIAYE